MLTQNSDHYTGYFLCYLSRDILNKMVSMVSLIQELENREGGGFLVTLLNYLLVAGEIPNLDQLKSFMAKTVLSETGEEIMSIARQLLEEGELRGELRGITIGEQRGISIGERAAKVEVARNLLANNLSKELVAKATGLRLEEISQLEESVLHF